MLITLKKIYFLEIAEVYFADKNMDSLLDVDVIIYFQSSIYTAGCQKSHTLHLDLTKSEEKLFSELHKSNRYKIKKAQNKDELEVIIYHTPTDEDIKVFSKFYNVFAKNKGLEECSLTKLKALKESNGLVISAVMNKANHPLCYHAYIIDGQRARVLYSASLFRLPSERDKRNLIGRANRYLHWRDIQSFKEKGFKIYDFGGLTLDENNEMMSNIDQFKMSFGGEVVTEYIYYQAKSLFGKLYKIIRRTK